MEKGFLLTSHFEDYKGEHLLRFYGTSDSGAFCLEFTGQYPVFFISRDEKKLPNLRGLKERKEVKLESMAEVPVDALYFLTYRDLREAKDELAQKGVRTYESDVRAPERFLMERFINGAVEFSGESKEKRGTRYFRNPLIKPCTYTPNLKVMSFDIETSMKNDLFSIGYHQYQGEREDKKVFMVGPKGVHQIEECELVLVDTEEELIKIFDKELKKLDPDVLIGWHVIGFDMSFLERKYIQYGIEFNWGRGTKKTRITERKGAGWFAYLEGRVVVDGPPSLRSNFFSFENFKLDTVAKELLGVGKDITEGGPNKVEEIERRFHEDKKSLAKYNLLDCILVSRIYKKTGILEMIIKRTQICGLLMDRVGVSTAAFDHFLLPRLHRKGIVANNIPEMVRDAGAVGGFVMEPEVGLHDHVIVLDFMSLYPSIIKTFKIDPYSRIKNAVNTGATPSGLSFSRSEHILPDFIIELMDLRAQAKRDDDPYLSQAIKILMNSFYGVMGSTGCRFYHADLPTAITESGQWILKTAISFFESEGYKVLYGDTDSVFVKLKGADHASPFEKGSRLANDLTVFLSEKIKILYGAESELIMEFEKYYKKFFLPASRGTGAGAKKKYVGLVVKGSVESLQFAGMEYVRSDSTKLAKKFQFSLYEKLFSNEEMEDYIRDFVEELKNGEHDRDLEYTKRLTKPPKEYIKSVPPHVKAALQLPEKEQESLRRISYIITRRGPVPITLDHSDIDYQHYIDKQIRPLAEDVLWLVEKSFDDIITGDQLKLF
jgi:DNA polymerase-2